MVFLVFIKNWGKKRVFEVLRYPADDHPLIGELQVAAFAHGVHLLAFTLPLCFGLETVVTSVSAPRKVPSEFRPDSSSPVSVCRESSAFIGCPYGPAAYFRLSRFAPLVRADTWNTKAQRECLSATFFLSIHLLAAKCC